LIVLAGPLVRAAMWWQFGATATAMTREFQAIADALATGALLACAMPALRSRAPLLAVATAPWLPAIGVALLAAASFSYSASPAAFYVFGQSLANIAIAAILLNAVTRGAGLLDTLLNVGVLAWVGRISYSLYLWQEFFLDPSLDSAYTRWPLNLPLAFLVAAGSYYLIERPLLRLRDRLPARLGGALAVR
jgi:peptidoglycan/LPS O-acetylase OafA/YrhL